MSAWIKLMNSLRSHPKLLGISDAAFRLYISGLLYSNEHLTDGRIDRHVLGAISPATRRPSAACAELVRASLWEVGDGYWTIHDFLDVQSSAEEVLAKRAAVANRVRRHRARNGVTPDERNSVTNTVSNADVTPPEGRRKKTEETSDEVSSPEFSDDVVRLCQLQSRLIRERVEEPEQSRRYLPTRAWKVEMDRLIRLDGRSPQQVEWMIRWVHRDSFWGGVVLSTPTLRERFGQLVAAAKKQAVAPAASAVDDKLEQLRREAGAGDVIEGSEAA